MLEREELLSIYEIYKELLTPKQQAYFEYYYYEDYSLSEISQNLSVSKTIIGKTINTVIEKLKNYESILKIHDTNKKLKIISESTNDSNTKKELDKIIK